MKKKTINYLGKDLISFQKIVSGIEKEVENGSEVRLSAVIYRSAGEITPLRAKTSRKREALGMSQGELASLVGLTQSRISQFEAGIGDIGFDQFLRMLKILTVSFRSHSISGRESRGMTANEFFKTARIGMRLTQTDLSRLSGVGLSMISYFESGGRISVKSLEKLMPCLGIELL